MIIQFQFESNLAFVFSLPTFEAMAPPGSSKDPSHLLPNLDNFQKCGPTPQIPYLAWPFLQIEEENLNIISKNRTYFRQDIPAETFSFFLHARYMVMGEEI